MALSIGIVGLPNVGKSTLFNTLTQKQIEASNYPFCTIDPNVGVVKVPDERLDKIAEISRPAQVLPTTIEFWDIAGLVKGANQGEGLGNQFLANIRECDAICEVVRDFKDGNIIHVDGQVNPNNDRETISTELILADLATVEKRLEKAKKQTKGGGKEAAWQQEVLEKLKDKLGEGAAIRDIELSQEEKEFIKELHLLTAKPILYVLNVDEGHKDEDVSDWPDNALKLNIKLEQEIASLPEEEQADYIREMGLQESGLNRLIKSCYNLLDLITFFTTGQDESKAWTTEKGSTAPEAAGRIHSDIQEGFIRAEVINWRDFIEAGGEQAAKEKGLMGLEGKDYVVQDGDVCHFLHNK
ncbi:MAG TPA: redox-regulated ATPase YchF [Patescibacteria group bacterium]|nr:redox-regulated ATPase YchF [Patescibacteria group bacterium]